MEENNNSNFRSITIKLDPNSQMKKYLENCFGYNRYVYNKGLEYIINHKKEWDFYPNLEEISYHINHTQQPWESELPSFIRSTALQRLMKAMKRFYNGIARFPTFRKKNLHNSFTYYTTQNIDFIYINKDYHKIKFPMGRKCNINRKYRWIRLTENPVKWATKYGDSIVKTLTIFKHLNNYYVNFQIELKHEYKRIVDNQPDSSIGLDPGLKTFVHTSDNTKIVLPKKKLNFIENKIKFYKRQMAKIQVLRPKDFNQSKKYLKARVKQTKYYLDRENLLNNFLHKKSTQLANKYNFIFFEGTDFSKMSQKRNNKIKSIRSLKFDNPIGTFRQLLSYKANNFSKTPEYFPSTQICSNCGTQKVGLNKLKLHNRVFRCQSCGFTLNRDHNAARNINRYGRLIAGLSAS